MRTPVLSLLCGLGLTLGSVSAYAQTDAVPVVGDELRALITGRSLALSTYGDATNPATSMVWNFRRNGSVCARPVAAKPSDKCADEGTWTLKGDVLCWELTWFGGSFGFKSACSSLKRTADAGLQLNSVSAPDLVFMNVRPL